MAWTTPLTAVANVALTAAQWNASVRDNLTGTAPGIVTTASQYVVSTAANTIAARQAQGAEVQVSESTTSTSYVALITPGPAAAATSGTTALVSIGAKIQQATSSTESIASYAVSGATTIASSDTWAMSTQFPTAGTESHRMSVVRLQTGLTPGNNTFTMQYRVTGGTGTYDRRILAVIPF